ncbi:MAG: DUF4040 domain-containing protein [Fimbriimonadaceae bacterium]|nr:DUF4040 domain-containing protein [Fimbriimonadaceae bacterium]
MTPALAILSLFTLGLLAPFLFALLPRHAGKLLCLPPAFWCGWFWSKTPASGQTWTSPWIPELGITFSFRLDGLASLFAILITGIGAMVLLYTEGYCGAKPGSGRLYGLLLLFLASMLGVVLADDAILLFLFWEATSVTSFLLIGFEHERANARRGAVQALMVTGGGGLALLAGLLVIVQQTGQGRISAWGPLAGDPLYLAMFALVAIGCFTKSAQFPFHFWLPNAMTAPTPVSAYLHSATMVKAGVYLLARLSGSLGGTEVWTWTLTLVGGATMLTGTLLALRQTDLKRLLAYSTVAALGTMVFVLARGGAEAASAFAAFVLAHALYKGALFLVAGAIDHTADSRDAFRLGGLWQRAPVLATASTLAGLGMMGVAPLAFLAKETLVDGLLSPPDVPSLIVFGVMAAGAVAIAGIVAFRPFFGKADPAIADGHKPDAPLLTGPAVLAVLGIVGGLTPTFVFERIGGPVAAAIGGGTDPHPWALWHGFGAPLAFSVGTLALGLAVYRAWPAWIARAAPWPSFGFDRAYDAGLRGTVSVARAFTRTIQNGRLRAYLQTTIATFLVLVTLAAVRWNPSPQIRLDTALPHEALLALAMLLAVLAAVRSVSRLAAVVTLGVVGFGVALTYALFGAPDLAMTQIAVETLTVILFVLTFYHLPRFARGSGTRTRAVDALLATGVGATMAAITLVASQRLLGTPISAHFAENSLAEAHGRNVVNVILVDYRGLDTLGEITVLSIAGLGVVALWTFGRRAAKGGSA